MSASDILAIADRITALLASTHSNERLKGLSIRFQENNETLCIYLLGRPAIDILTNDYRLLTADGLYLLLTQYGLDSDDCSHLLNDGEDSGESPRHTR